MWDVGHDLLSFVGRKTCWAKDMRKTSIRISDAIQCSSTSSHTGWDLPGDDVRMAMREGETLLVNGEDLTYRQIYEKMGQAGEWFGDEIGPIGCASCGSTCRGNRYKMLQMSRETGPTWECLVCATNGFIAMKIARHPSDLVQWPLVECKQ